MTKDASANAEEQKRRSERVLLRIPIEVTGNDAAGKPFQEKSFTLFVNRDGARIGSKTLLKANDRISITNLQNKMKCPFRVVGRTSKSMGEGPEWGVECLEPDLNFWGILFPAKSAAPAPENLIDALLECSVCMARELAKLTMEDYRQLAYRASINRVCERCGVSTDWRFGFAEADQEGEPYPATTAKPAPGDADEEERRRAKRLTVKLHVRIRTKDGKEETARTENISKTGICFMSEAEIQEGEVIHLSVGPTAGTQEPRIAATIVWRRQLEGSQRYLYGVRLNEPE